MGKGLPSCLDIDPHDWHRFLDLREETLKQIALELEEDGHCKSYEGTFTVSFTLPNYFVERCGDTISWWGFTIKLAMYLINPYSRHAEWEGKTFKEALDKAEKDLRKWFEWAEVVRLGEDPPEEYYTGQK